MNECGTHGQGIPPCGHASTGRKNSLAFLDTSMVAAYQDLYRELA